MPRFPTAPAFALALAMLPAAAAACGPDSKCEIGDGRFYYLAMPEAAPAEKVGAIVFAHGYRGTASGPMSNAALRALAADLGVAFIAVKSDGDDWALPNSPGGDPADDRDDIGYFEEVLDDAAARFAIDRDRVMVSGFSAGGMMVWQLACDRSDLFAAYAPMSGTFWAPVPETCTGPAASIVHMHGDADSVVPLDGRPIQDTSQGSVPRAIEMYSAYGDFAAPEAAEFGELSCDMRKNDAGAILNFCLFPGGHSLSAARIRTAWEMFEAAGAL